MQNESVADILAPGVEPKAPPAPEPSPLAETLDLPVVPEPVTRRRLDDFRTTRTAMYDNVMKAVQGRYPYENNRYKLSVENLKWAGPERFSLADQKKAIMRGETLDRRLEGEWVLYDKEAGMEAARRKSTIAHVPHMTGRGTFISKGNEYTVANQMRLKPGVYTRVKDNGIIEAHVNVRPGSGPSFRVYMEPDTGLFRMAVGQSNLKLYPILKSMGVSDDDLEKYWGRELLARNRESTDPRAVQRAFNKLVKVAPTLEDEALEDEADAKTGTKEAADHVPTIAIDFDGTIAEGDDWPKIGKPRPGVKKALEVFQQAGHRIIINTCRGDVQQIKDYMHEHDLPYDYVNENPTQPDGTSDKIMADVYIDDRAIDGTQSWKKLTEQAMRAINAEADKE